MSPAGDLRRPVARIGPRPGPDVTRGWATIGLAAASLACWAVQAVAVLGGALWLRRCTDECHGAVLGPLTVTVLLAPAGVGLLVAGLAAWDRAGRAVPASRAVQMALLGAGAGALVGVGVGAMIGYRPAAAGNGLLVYELFAFVNLAALGATAVVMGRRLG